MDSHQLMDAVQAYPWFAAARAQLCLTVAADSGTDNARGLFTEALPYLPDGVYVYRKMHMYDTCEYRDANLKKEEAAPVAERPRIIMAGSDFFSKEDYEGARTSEDASISSIAIVDYSTPAPEFNPSSSYNGSCELISETLAEIYANQGYPQQAKEIYLKLSLESPEKSAYFASLIDNLK